MNKPKIMRILIRINRYNKIIMAKKSKVSQFIYLFFVKILVRV